MNQNKNLSGKVAIVTGSSRGIGRAVAERLGRDGASVAVNFVQNHDLAVQVVTTIQDHGGQAIAIQADMGRVAEIKRLFDETIHRFGRLDILVHSAALFHPGSVAEVTEEQFDADFATNAKGAFFALQEAALRMENGGRIVYISSCATSMFAPNFAVYSGSKAAGEQFAMILAKELGPREITVNIVSPGFTLTDMLPEDPAWRKFGADLSPFKRLGQPDEVANVVAFLVSQEAGWITGENIRASGGVGMS